MDLTTGLHILLPIVTALAAWFGGRKLNKATIAEKGAATDEKQANTIKILTDVSESMARQLQAFEDEVPTWKARISQESKRADEAEKYNDNARVIQEKGAIIADHLTHIHYWQGKDEPEDPMGRRVREMKECAAIMRKCSLPARTSMVTQIPEFPPEV